MSSDTFRFKQFSVKQSQSAMKVGTDGVILGAWVSLDDAPQNILDVGTGTGLIAMMMAQRAESALSIDAVEIEANAAQEALYNFNLSPWSHKLATHHTSFQSFTSARMALNSKYDLIVSNPPYFIASLNVSKEDTSARIAARHAELLPYDDLIEGVVSLLAPQARFAAIFPYQEAGVFIAKAAAKGLYCNRKLSIHPMPHRPIKRIAAEFSLTKSVQCQEETLVIANSISQHDGYTEQYKGLTYQFYIKF